MQVFRRQHKSTLLAHSVLFAGLVLITCATAWAGSPNYAVTNLGTLGPGASQAYSINSQGLIAGYSATNSGNFDGFSWQNGTMSDLGTFLGGQYSFAYGVNDNGQIVGTAADSSGNFHALLWQNGHATDLGFLPGGSQAVAMAINDNGEVAGYACDTNNVMHAVTWQLSGSSYKIQDLGLFSGVSSTAAGINSNGDVVGSYTASDGTSHGFLWQGGAETNLGDLGGGQSYGEALNSQDEVVGQAEDASGDWHAFMWQSGQMTDLGALDGVTSVAFAVNDSGAVAGQSSSPDGTSHAVLWQGGQIVDLGSFVGQNSLADSINATGQIVGQGTINGATVGFLLTPQASTPPPVNPPVTTAMLEGRHRSGNTWFRGPVTVTLTATDQGGPGVASTYYTVDGGAQTTYSAPFQITGDAAHTLTYWSVDDNGNAESPNSKTVSIDTTPPVTTAALAGNQGSNGWYTGPVTVTLTAQDALSGVAQTLIQIDWRRPLVYSTPVTLDMSGRHVVRFWSVDVAGNEEAPSCVRVKIDTTPPTIHADASARSLGSGNWEVTISGSAGHWPSHVSGAPTVTSVTDNEGSVSPSNVTSRKNDCGFKIQFTVNIPSTAAGSSNSSNGPGARCESGGSGGKGKTPAEQLTVGLSVQDDAGLTGTTTVHVNL